MAREIDLDNKLIKETPVVPQQLFFNNFSDNIKDEFPFEVPSSSTQPPFQDFHRLNHPHHHHDQFHPDIGSSPNPVMEVQTGSNFDPFDAFPYGTSSATMDFFEYDIKPFGDTSSTHHHHPVMGHHGQVMDNFQVGGGEYLNLPMLPQRNHPIDLVGSNQDHNHININPQGEMSMHYNGANSSSSNNNNRAPPSIRRTSGKYRKKNTVVKGQWTAEEDRVLVQLVEQHGIRKWSLIAQMLPGRIGKQCRERWHNHLRPDIKKDTWSEEEDRVLIQAHAEIGNKWAEIAKRLPGRTENSIKNHWNATKRRQYSKRKCRSKYPRGSLLQEYIKSLNLDAPVASTAIAGAGRVENGKASVTDNANMGITNNNSTIDTTVKVPNCLPQELDFCLNDRLVPTFDFNEMVIPDFDFDEKMFQEGGCCNIDTLLDEIPCAPVVDEKSFCVDDVPCEDVSTVLMDSEVKKEMDLVDMISQS